VLGFDCLAYLGSGGDVGAKGVWERQRSIDWSAYDACLQQAGQRRVTLPDGEVIPQPVILTFPPSYSDTGARYYNTTGRGEPGSQENPFMRLHLPPWMQNDAYRFTLQSPAGQWYQSLRYSGEFKQRMIELIRAAGERYNANPQVSAVRVYVGVQGESQPIVPCQPFWDVVPPAGRDAFTCRGDASAALLAEHEKTVSCEEFTAFVRDLSEAALRAFPDKAVVSMVDVPPCSNVSARSFRRWLYEEQWTGKPIGVSMNNLNIDRPDVDERPGNRLTKWNAWTVGRTLRELGYPMAFEYDAHQPSIEGMYWTVLSGAGNGGNFVLYHHPWRESFSEPMWEVVDYWLASERRAWLVFRDREYPTYDFADGFGLSGSIGDFGKYLRLLNPDHAPQACSPALAKAARSANATVTARTGNFNVTPACADAALPTPAITPAATPSPGADLYTRLFNRQARRLDPGATWRIAVSGDWPAFGYDAPAQVSISYLDAGRDSFEVSIAGSGGEPVRHTIRKGGTGAWMRAEWPAGVTIGNTLAGDAFIQITNDATGPEHLHEIFVTVPKGLPFTPTPSPTTRPSATPTASPTATTTSTVLPSATPSPSPVASATPTSTAIPPSATLTPSATATFAATLAPSATPAATSTPQPPATATRPPTSVPTPTRSLPSPTATPTAPPPPTTLPQPNAPAASCLPRSLGIAPLPGPRSIAASPRGFYVALFEASEVARLDPVTRRSVWQIPTGDGRANGIAVSGDTLVVSNRDRGTVTLHDALTGAPRATLATGALPWGMAAADGRAYVANFGDNTISVVDLDAARVIRSVAVAPLPVTVVIAEGRPYVLHLNGLLTRLDREGNALGQSPTGLADTRGIAYDPLRGRLYVGSEGGAVVALRQRDLAEVARYDLPGPAYAVAVNESTGRIYAVDAQGDTLHLIEPDTAEVVGLPLPPQGGAQGGQGLAAAGTRIAVANFAANSVSFFDDSACPERITPTPAAGGAAATSTATAAPTLVAPTRTATRPPTNTPTRAATAAPAATATSRPTATATVVPSPTPDVVRAKVEIVWPHGGAGVQDAERANVTVYLLAGDGSGPARSLLDSVPCAWDPTVRLWAALNNEPARQVGIGQKRMIRSGGRVFPAWDFNDVDVSAARDPANKIAFTATVDSVRTLSNVWTHAADARTLFPQQDAPTGVARLAPSAVDARIQIVWPHGGLPPQQAQRANITTFLFSAGTMQAASPSAAWSPVVRLHWSLNNEPERAPGQGIVGTSRPVQAANGVRFVAWDFNDVDVSPANDSLNRMTFWVSVDGAPSYSNFWAHAVDARTLFPQPDVLNSCK
jgi:YVTN family beta-propeller protein